MQILLKFVAKALIANNLWLGAKQGQAITYNNSNPVFWNI